MPVLLFFCGLVTVQETLYALLGLSGGALFVMRALADLGAISLLVFYVFRFSIHGRPMPLTGLRFEWFFLPFLLYSVMISLAVSGSNLALNLSEILVLNRFVFLAIALPFIVTSPERIDKVLRLIWILILFQVGLGVIQFVGGSGVVALFAPSDYSNILADVERSFTSNRELTRSFLIGSMGDFLSYSYIILFGILMILSRDDRRPRSFVLLLLFCFLLFQSGSRTVFLVGMLLTVHYLFSSRRLVTRVVLTLIALPAIPVGFVLLSATVSAVSSSSSFEYGNFISLLDARIIDNLMNQRLGIFLAYLPALLGYPVVVTGLSPDRFFVAEYATRSYPHLPYVLMYYIDSLLEDFYLAAILSYYGLIGAVLFYGMYLRLYLRARNARQSADPRLARLARLMAYALLAITLLSFANQSYENRGLAFFTWMSVGLFASALQIERRRRVTEGMSAPATRAQPTMAEPGTA